MLLIFVLILLKLWVCLLLGFWLCFVLAFTGNALYELLTNYLLTEEQLKENNFPRPNPGKNGHAILSGVLRNTVYDGKCLLDCNKIEFQSVVHRTVKYTGIKLYIMSVFCI